jgi:hypothetical protein
MKYDEDLQTINLIVNTSPTQEIARERFFNTVGFAIPEDAAKKAFEEAMAKRFTEQPNLKQEISRLAALLHRHDHR